MSHCSDVYCSLPEPGIGVDGSSPLTGLFLPWFQPDEPGPHGTPGPVTLSFTSAVRVAPTDATTFLPVTLTSSRNAARSDCATITPICGHDCTTTPPEATTAASALRTWPGFTILVLMT